MVPVLLLFCSPVIPDLAQRHDLSMSDFPSHDMAAEFVLLAEHRQVEHDLKEQYEVRCERGRCGAWKLHIAVSEAGATEAFAASAWNRS